MKISVVREDENLLDKVTLDRPVAVVRIVSANLYHLPHKRTHNEKAAAVHTGNWVINDDYLIPCFSIRRFTAVYKMIEIKERNKIVGGSSFEP